MIQSGRVTPVYYPLEAATNLDECQTVDDRYVSQAANNLFMPSQYDVQMLSGVLPTLKSLPYFDQYVPDYAESK